MKVLLLGTAAGGGFPQWNCSCAVCSTARRDPAAAHPRTQSSVAIGSDRGLWFLVNVSPDVQQQMERHGLASPLRKIADCSEQTEGWNGYGAAPGESAQMRRTVIESAFVTNADLDHVLGLMMLREGDALKVICRPPVRDALSDGLGLERTLSNYCGIAWLEAPYSSCPLLDRNGDESGLSFRAVRAKGGPPRYRGGHPSADGDDSVGYLIKDEATGKSVLVLPDVDSWSDEIEAACAASTLVLFDGTFWSERELLDVRPGARTASQMGHLAIDGPEGSLHRLGVCPAPMKAYIHINNTNPILLEGSAERSEVQKAGVAVGDDGMMWVL